MSESSANNPAATMLNRRRRLLGGWSGGWQDMTRQWATGESDALWVMYSANYLLRTGGVRWAIDPLRLNRRLAEAPKPPMEVLAAASFIVLTHNHADHVDAELLAYLATLDHLKWIIPQHMVQVAEAAKVPSNRVIVPEAGEPITMGGGAIRITPFTGMHWQYPGGRWNVGEPSAGIDSTGYLFEWAGKRLLLPGDTRTYDPAALPAFGPVDTLLAHVWLGRGGALLDPPPLLEAFCRFVSALKPARRVLLTHLWEQGRTAADYWDERHAGKVKQALAKLLPPSIDIQIPEFWKVNLI